MNTFSTTGLIVFCALLGSVFSEMFCKYCHERNGTTCKNETVVECVGGRCMSVCQYLIVEGVEMWSFYKSCADPSMSQSGIEALHLRFYMKSNMSSCFGNGCNIDKCNLSKRNRTRNGLFCPYCFKSGTMKKCTPVGKIECEGLLDMCYQYSGNITFSDGTNELYTELGCSNIGLCNSAIDSFIGFNETERKWLSCEKARPATPH
ncbi:phospholipase A2 inhibitor and Ly6/PLAUR domain-containing protein-like [Leptodactylus fuscus]